MLNSLLMCVGSNSNFKVLSSVARMAILINLMYVQFAEVNNIFFVVNMFLLFTIPQLISRIKNKYTNIAMSAVTILIWSILIDILSYYLFPLFKQSCSIFVYVLNGIEFNLKYVISNLILLVVLYSIDGVILKKKNISKKNYVVYKRRTVQHYGWFTTV